MELKSNGLSALLNHAHLISNPSNSFISPNIIICFINKRCIFSCLALKSLEYSVAYENLQPSTDAYKRVAYKKMSVYISYI